MTNSVDLKFPKTINSLAGYDYGMDIYNNQIKGVLDVSQEYIIGFPMHIKNIAYSFVQGLFFGIVNEIGLKAAEERLVIKSENENLEQIIKTKLLL